MKLMLTRKVTEESIMLLILWVMLLAGAYFAAVKLLEITGLL